VALLYFIFITQRAAIYSYAVAVFGGEKCVNYCFTTALLLLYYCFAYICIQKVFGGAAKNV
jgi:hypothetical protein